MPHDTDLAWWKTAVIYQIYPRSFKDTDGDGTGDLPGVIEKLDHLSETLGVDAVWLSPFYPSPMKDFGYDVADYCDVDPLFGSLGDFDRLVEEAHARGLKLIVDYVPNHSSDQHAWFKESRSSKDNPKRDWYVWRDPKADGAPPNNWLSVFGGPAWTFDEKTGQYYLHSFLKEQPDLNWRNAEVKEAMFDVLRFWLDRGVDGFRIDVAHAIMKDPDLRDNPPNPDPESASHKSHGAYDTQLHLYDKSHEDIHGVYQEMRRLIDGYDPPRLSLGEMHIYDWEKWTRYYGEALDEIHMPINFALLKADWTAASIRATVDGLEAALPEGAWPNYNLGNHDESRLATRLGGAAQARQAAVLLLTLRGTPVLYYGDELGLPDAEVPLDRRQDPWGFNVAQRLSRDPARTPMPWADGGSAGFSTAPPEKLWLPLGKDHRALSVERQMEDDGSMLAFYQRLLKLRKERRALHAGSYRPLGDVPESCFAYVRERDGERAVVMFNFSEETCEAALPDQARGMRLLLSTRPSRGTAASAGKTLRLHAHEAVVLGE